MSRTVSGDARPEWPWDPESGQGYSGQSDGQWRQPGGYSGAAGFTGHAYPDHGGYDRQDDYRQPQYDQTQHDQTRHDQRQYDQRQYDQTRHDQRQYDQPQYGQPQYGQRHHDQRQGQPRYGQNRGGPWQGGRQDSYPSGYGEQPTQVYGTGYRGPARGYGGRRPAGPGRPAPGSRPPGRQAPGRPHRRVRFRRARRLFRHRSVRAVSAVLAVLLVWLMFSVGQAAFRNNGQGVTANVAEWARDHNLGFVVTFGEWLTYNPPPKGGKPSFSLAVPKNQQISAQPAAKHKKLITKNKVKAKKKSFKPDVPAPLKSLAGQPLPGEGQWRVVEKVHGHPAIFTTFLRDATYTSEVNGIASMDQRLVKFQMHPGSEDPGPGNWGRWGSDYIPQGARTGLLATFNGGFKLDSAEGGFYLNGHYHGSLIKGAASVVYYKNGRIKIGEWGRDFKMNSSIEGVRQNLKLLVDHGKLAADANSNVMTNWGATLGGGYYVWRSGLGITKDGRIVYVYGPALNAQDLGELLKRAGAVEGMQLDINPYWMKYEYYTVKGGNKSDPVPTNLLPTQQQSAYTYYSPYTRDFTAVYAR